MTLVTDVARQPITPARPAEPPVGGLRFDAAMISLSTWLLGGLFLDGWAHAHIFGLDSFFTPWHAVFYSGALAVAAFLAGSLWHYHAQGYAWWCALPAGYAPSLLGMAIFGFSGLGDLFWHTRFGIEVGVAALLSPTHLGLGLGIGLIVTGPLRAAWQRPDPAPRPGWAALLPMLLSLTYLLSLLTFITEYVHPYIGPWPLTDSYGAVGTEQGVAATSGKPGC